MMLHKLYFFILLFLFSLQTNAQMTKVYTDDLRLFKEGAKQYRDNNPGYARLLFKRFLDTYGGKKDNYQLYLVQSQVYLIKIAFDLDQDYAEELFDEFEKRYSSHVLFNEALISKGRYYFRHKDYASVIKTFEKMDLSGLNFYLEDEVKFKLAYSYFVKKQFEKAAVLFRELSLIDRKYYYPANYYYGICQFLKGDFDTAIKSFNIIQNTEEYKRFVPYYLVQLYFTQGDYDKTIEVGEAKLKIKDVQNYYKIHHLVGQAYFLKKDYISALPHLEIYEKNTKKLRKEDFYQLGFIYHQLGKCEKAIPALKEIANLKTAMGQNANYYLADCYLKTGDKHSARTAFKNAGSLDFNNMIKEESILNYGKLSAEMGYDREAIDALLSLEDSSPFYPEAQRVLKTIFVNTKDYAKAQETLEKLDKVSSQLFHAYQLVSYYKALQEINDGKYDLAEEDLHKAEKINRDIKIAIQTHYWLAELLHRKGDYAKSNQYIDRYFVLIKGVDGVEDLTKPPLGYYLQGYNYYKLKNYPFSVEKFFKALQSFKKYPLKDKNLQARLINDIHLRIADGFFYEKKLDEAKKHYDFVINNNGQYKDYALYQKALIAGLEGKPFEKIALLEEILDKYKKSAIRPKAYFELANTYNELQQYEKAYKVYESIVKEFPDETALVNKAYLRMGLISYNKGDLDTAIANYKKVVENNPSAEDKKEALTALEEIYINDKKNADEYLQYVKTIPGVKVEGLYKDSLNFITAKLSFDEDSIDNAIKSFDEYLQKYEAGYYDLDAHFYRAESYLRKKKFRKALKDYEYIIKQGFSNYYEPALYKAAIIAFNYMKDYGKALKYYKKLEEIVKDESKKYNVQLGAMRSAFRLNDYKAVKKYGNKILNNPLTTAKERSAAHYYIAKVAASNKVYDTALSHFNKVIRENRNSNWAAEARYMIAEIYFKRNELELAKKLIKESNLKNTAYPYWVAKGLILLSDIYVKENDLFNARAALEAVKENYKEDKTILNIVNKKLKILEELEEKNSRVEKENPDGTIKMDSLK